jgi:hyperosmotically inducible periplasmic protein
MGSLGLPAIEDKKQETETMKSYWVLTIGSLLMIACDKPAEVKDDQKPVASDNTKMNERDRDGKTTTPGDQGENEADRGITKDVRAALMKKDELSTNAKNVKVVTNGGNVTLRGPVKDEAEKTSIVAVVTEVPGVKKVDNQLEIAK